MIDFSARGSQSGNVIAMRTAGFKELVDYTGQICKLVRAITIILKGQAFLKGMHVGRLTQGLEHAAELQNL